MPATDPFPAHLQALEARHRADLSFSEIRRALQALSSLYVERRARMAGGRVFDGAGKRAAFALYYAPMHFLLVREIVRALGPTLGARHILDLGCGTAAAGAAWALEQAPWATVDGIDASGWAVAEARWTLRQLGLRGEIRRDDAVSGRWPRGPSGVLAAYTVNELGGSARERLLERLSGVARAGSAVLVIEPIARRMSPWWPEWAAVFREMGGREDEWRFRLALPATLAQLGRAAGLDTRELSARSLALSAPGRS